MKAYKFRAECISDVIKALPILKNPRTIITTDSRFPDVTVKFSSNMSLKEIQKKLESIVDGHVMAETVQPYLLYTGKRKFINET